MSEFERLTKRNEHGRAEFALFIQMGRNSAFDFMAERLAQYEDSGLLPAEVTQLKTASKEAAEILGDMVDVANATGSAYLYSRDADRVMKVVEALGGGENAQSD